MTIHMRVPSSEPGYSARSTPSGLYYPVLCGVRGGRERISYAHLSPDDANYLCGLGETKPPTCEACILMWFQMRAESADDEISAVP